MSLPNLNNIVKTPNFIEHALDFLDKQNISYELVSGHDIEGQVFVRTVLFMDSRGYLLTILASSSILDFAKLCNNLSRKLEVVPLAYSPIPNCFAKEVGSYPPLPELLGIPCIIDEDIYQNLPDGKVIFPLANNGISVGENFASLSLESFKKLHKYTWEGDLSIAPTTIQRKYTPEISGKFKFTIRRMQARIEETLELPALPETANKLLKLRSCEKSDLNELARIVEQDPSLAAQLISWACSPFYAYPGNIKSVNDAIINVLGFDLVLNIALGISVGQIIKVPHGGPLGLANYWRHAIYCAALSEKIIAKAKTAEKLNRGFAYLAGLLHNFGHLLLGQTFPPQFFLLNQSLLASPEANVLDVEYHLFGVTHADLGAWLMDSWDMPQELVAISLHHHDLAYKGEHSDYVKVVKLANLILKDMGIGDEVTSEVPAKLLDDLGLTSADITHITNEFNQHLAELDEITAVLTR